MKKFKIKPLIVLVLVGVLIFSLYNLFLIYKQNADEQKALNSIKNVIDTKETTITAGILLSLNFHYRQSQKMI